MVVTDLKRVIAYSTMSQIGYMIMGVSSAAYTAGLFHLMTHAFFKALLFMSAGSVIAAMAGNQNLDEMGGFRRAMPFTFGCMIIGGLALAGFPPFSGYFSKDDILAFVAARDDWHVVLAALGFVGSFLTAIYTFRMIFRTFWGDPVEPANVLMTTGHLYHAPEHTNPATGEVEDTDVGFPGPDHHIAEHEGSMKVAMGGAGRARDHRRRPADPEGHRRAAPLPRADLRGLAVLQHARALRRADRVRPDRRRRARRSAASRSRTTCGCASPRRRPRCARASPRCITSS